MRRVGNRYEIEAELGRGGMARVYRARDLALGRDIALKELTVPAAAHDRETFTTLFEREYRTLSQLRHPRVIAVYDYGVESTGPYYTMELLDGGDLRDRGVVPWREACGLLFDVCSSLALLHSRQLLHRDISPRNVRCTQDGKAKLIDFGAMAAMTSGGATIVGTPAFTAPETVHRLALDGRADLFSLGATLYSVLTGRLAFPVRTFAEAMAAWNTKPAPPSASVADIPAALDELVLSLLNVEPSLRPSSAFEVMQRLAAVAGLTSDESADVSAAYLVTPKLVGREAALETMRARLYGAQHGRSGGVLIRAEAGLGRSRLLDACALEAKTQGSTVLRAAASGDPAPFAVARALVEHLLAAVPAEDLLQLYPELFEHGIAEAPERVTLRSFTADAPDSIQRALSRFILTVSRSLPLVLAVDDVHRIDPASAALLATLLDKAARGKLLVLLTAEASADTPSVDVLSRRCELTELSALTLEQLQRLFSSLFGDVANVDTVAREIHAVALGNPQHAMDMAQHLVDRGLIRYAAGIWILPAQLRAADLPRSAEDALRAKLAGASNEARWLGQAHALAYEDLLTDAQYRALRPDADARATDDAVSELLALGAITSAGTAYALSNRSWGAVLRERLPRDTESALHRALADMYEPTSPLALVYHAFAGGDDERGLGAFAARIKDERVDPKVLEGNLSKLVPAYLQALQAALKHGRPPRELATIRRWSVALSIATEGELYSHAAPAWFEQLRHDAGLDLWQADRESATAGDRLMSALSRAHARYLATPEAERVYAVDEAIRLLAEYVLMSIVVGGRVLDLDLLASLPGILEPFAPLSPILDAIWHNAIATEEAQCENRLDAACERWRTVLEKLDALPATELTHIDMVRNAIAFALGLTDAQLGLPTALTYAERLDGDPFQKLSALHLRKIVRLTQGDWAGADRLRREAEVLGLHLHSLQMFKIVLYLEVNVFSKARDLAGLRQSIEQARPLGAKWPAWDLYVRDAEAYFDMVRGDLAAARRGFEQGMKRTAFGSNGRSPSMSVWLTCRVGLAEVLLELGEAEASRAVAREGVDMCERLRLGTASYDLQRALALADAACGAVAVAMERLDTVIEAQTRAGVSGLPLGLNYEARARIAIWSKDPAAFEEFSRLAAREYRRGANSPLGVRYERLVNEALRCGFQASAGLRDFEPSTLLETGTIGAPQLQTMVVRAMLGAARTEDRALRALRLLCETLGAKGGHLFLMGADRPQLAASHGVVVDPEGLVEAVHDFVIETQARSEERTMIVSAEAVAAEPAAATTSASAGGVDHELLILTHVAGGAGLVAGVAALARDGQRAPFAQQTQLLNALAAQLVQAGDVTGHFEVG